MPNEKITIEKLAGMVKGGFDGGVDKRFDEDAKQHQEIFNRLDKLEGLLALPGK